MSERVSGRMRIFIEDSWSFFERGVGELEEGLREGDALKVRDAAEKLWNAVVSAANALVLSRTGIVPASHWERRRLLDKIEEEEPEVEKLGLRGRYGAREKYLHEVTFYDGIIDRELLKREVEKVKRFIVDVQRLVESAPRTLARSALPERGSAFRPSAVSTSSRTLATGSLEASPIAALLPQP